MQYIRIVLFPCFLVYICLVLFSPAHACTIWAAAGKDVKGGGTLIAKNRDNFSHFYTALKGVSHEKDLSFYGLFDTEADGYVTAGVNEKGLVVINASANSVPKIKRYTATEDLTQRLLTSFDSVTSVLSESDLFRKSHPAIYIIGDASRIASIEVAPGARISVSMKEKGTLAFTNHYTSPDLGIANEQLSTGSFTRLERIQHLLSCRKLPFGIDDFIAFSNDAAGGSEGALWRSSAAPNTIRTLASWIIYVPQNGPPVLHVKLANDNEAERTVAIVLDGAFWREIKGGVP
jgi:hypothetical protein